MLRAQTVFMAQVAVFIVLNGADLLLTRLLLGQDVAAAYEGNPVAAWLLGRHGWAGLAAFKVATAVLVAGSAAAIFARRPRLGAGVLAFGCATLAVVVAYSGALLGATRVIGSAVRDREAAAARRNDRLDDELRVVAAWDTLKDRLARDLIAGRCGIPEAVDRLMTGDKSRDQVWLRGLRDAYVLDTDRDCLAANFVNHVLRIVRREPELVGRLPEWLAAYQTHFRVPGNPPWQKLGLSLPDVRTALKPAATPPPARPDA